MPFVVRLPGVTPAGSTTSSLISAIDLAPTVLELAGITPPPPFQGRSFLPILKDPTATIRQYAISEHNWHDYKATERSARDDRFRYILNELPELPGTPPADAVRSPTYVNMLQQYADGTLPVACRGPLEAPRAAEELYDLQADPYELHNLAENPRYADQLERMRKRVQAWKREIGDPGTTGGSEDRFDRTTGKRLGE
jgi:arylsulfatase A-like enzyme